MPSGMAWLGDAGSLGLESLMHDTQLVPCGRDRISMWLGGGDCHGGDSPWKHSSQQILLARV